MMEQLLCHLWGDYVLQSDWMAQNKTKNWFPALIHAMVYTLCFAILIGHSRTIWSGVVICFSHFLIDRFRLARYVVWAKNWLGPYYEKVIVRTDRFGNAYFQTEHWRRKNPTPDFAECQPTGYPATNPVWLATWLLIIADNTLHLTINFLALKYL
jgi:uncharacterized protein DUF3307